MATAKTKPTPAKKTTKRRSTAKSTPTPDTAPEAEFLLSTLDAFEKRVERLSSEMRRAIGEVSVAAQVLALGPDRIAHIPSHDHMFRFHLPQVNRDVTQRKMLLHGTLPNAEGYSALALRLPRGGVVIDIGGYLGVSACFFSKICKADEIHVFEPQNVVLDILRRNLELNNVENAIVHAHAVVDKKTKVDPGGFKAHDLGGTPFLKHAKGQYQGVSLDSMDFETVDIIHMDFAGPKMLALAGASSLITRCKPFIIVDKGSRDLRDIIDYVLPMGYRHDQSAGLMMFYPDAE